MKVEIWSDVVCPWCYIGKRRFESALSQFPQRDRVEVSWRSFQLDPSAPRSPEQTVAERLAGKYGVTLQQAAAMNERVSRLAAQDGLDYHLDRARGGNTFDAHRLIHLAAAHGLQQEMKERLFHAYFTEGQAIGDLETLIALTAEVGIDADEARSVLTGDADADAVRTDERRARSLGITGVPFFVLDDKYGVSGAQPAEVLHEVLEHVWAESHPLITPTAVPRSAADTCEGDACALPEG